MDLVLLRHGELIKKVSHDGLEWEGTTVFKHFTTIFRFRPYRSFLVCLRTTHIVALGGITFVTALGVITTLIFATLGDLLLL
jgi:hypothetical protein